MAVAPFIISDFARCGKVFRKMLDLFLGRVYFQISPMNGGKLIPTEALADFNGRSRYYLGE